VPHTKRRLCLLHRPISLRKSSAFIVKSADPGGSAVYGVDLMPLEFGDRGFESRLRRMCSSLVFTVWCVGSGFCDELIGFSEESYQMYVCDLETLKGDVVGPI
jgi:hypothetical protein